ncbi:hypothetical protein F511_28831 [Dorcoceras hygrometricum]|uniref:Uncharacterized protein n=1 Tax=Dorcoceras hygrometricum TaxID=472368 RepID=A0A2Z7DE17_9LAMI|nr:hypothetical protein F511_28831 [Dorcoceras hygrometricum]
MLTKPTAGLTIAKCVASLKTKTLRSHTRRPVKSEIHEPLWSTPKPQTGPVHTILATCAPHIWFLPNDVALLSTHEIQLAYPEWLETTRFDYQPRLPSTSAKAEVTNQHFSTPKSDYYPEELYNRPEMLPIHKYRDSITFTKYTISKLAHPRSAHASSDLY